MPSRNFAAEIPTIGKTTPPDKSRGEVFGGSTGVPEDIPGGRAGSSEGVGTFHRRLCSCPSSTPLNLQTAARGVSEQTAEGPGKEIEIVLEDLIRNDLFSSVIRQARLAVPGSLSMDIENGRLIEQVSSTYRHPFVSFTLHPSFW